MSDRGNVKRYSILKEEREKIQNIQSVIGILALQREGLNNSINMLLMGIRMRLAIKDSDAPKGYVRSVDFDPTSYELVVTDSKLPEAGEGKAADSKAN